MRSKTRKLVILTITLISIGALPFAYNALNPIHQKNKAYAKETLKLPPSVEIHYRDALKNNESSPESFKKAIAEMIRLGYSQTHPEVVNIRFKEGGLMLKNGNTIEALDMLVGLWHVLVSDIEKVVVARTGTDDEKAKESSRKKVMFARVVQLSDW
jgi:hypothetical protein